MSLDLSARVAARDLAVDLTVEHGETLALLGANGSGKSTLLSVAAGLLVPHDTLVRLGERTLTDTRGSASVHLPPHARGVGLMAQDPGLFPHLSALENVAFGPRSRGVPRRTAHATAREWLARVGMAGLEDRRPGQLSGGQAQRVALARALAPDPDLLLLDEPLAALDVAVTPAVRATLNDVLADRTTIIVTHDVLDALLLADRVAVLEAGRLAEVGPTRDVLARPTSAFAARIAGLNLVAGAWDGSAVVTSDGRRVHGQPSDPAPTPGSPAVAVFRPASVALYPRALPGSPRNSFETVVETLEPHGDLLRVHGGAMSADITLAAAADLGLAPGAVVHFVVKSAEVDVHPAHRHGAQQP